MPPKTPKQNKAIRVESRQQIQEAAFELFAQKGYANTSISAIARKAEVSKGLIYHYFDSKEAILEAIFHYWVGETKSMLDFPEDWPAIKKLEQLIQKLFGFIQGKPESSRLLLALALQPDAVATIKSHAEEMNMKQIEIGAELFKELNYEHPQEEAYYLGARLDGITIGYLTLGEGYPLEAMKQKLLEEYIPDENN